MNDVLIFVLLFAATILLALAAFGRSLRRFNTVAAGLACWAAAELVAHWPR